MDKLLSAALTICVLLASTSVGLSGAFQDLDFESAVIAAAPPNYTPVDAGDPISAAAALPGWTVFEDTTQCTAVWGAALALDETSVTLLHEGGEVPATPIDGTYSVGLTSYVFGSSYPGYYSTSLITQTGFVPAGTRSIQFLVADSYGPGPIVTLGSTQLSLQTISTSDGIATMVADVTAFAGKTDALTFLCQGPGAGKEDGYELDDITFSPNGVPEPLTTTTIAFMMAVGCVCGLRKKLNGVVAR